MAIHNDEIAAQLAARLTALEGRVTSLEAGQASGASAARVPTPDMPWAVDVLRERRGEPFESPDARGGLVYAGYLRTPGTGLVAWQIERPVPPALRRTWEVAAPVLAALGHPVRLEIVRRLLLGARTSQDLQEIPEIGSTGRLYHHLRELQECGLVESRRRNRYGIAQTKVVPCLVMIAAAAELGVQQPSQAESDGDGDEASHGDPS